MKIAYDLRYADGHFTGIGTHAYALLESLLALPGNERYAVLWNPDLGRPRYRLDRIAAHPRVTWNAERFSPIHPIGTVQVGAWLRRIRPAVYFSPFYLLPVAARCPCVLTIHDVWPLRLPEGFSWARWLLYRASLFAARRARFIVTSSEFSRSEIITLVHVPPERVRSIPPGVPPRLAPVESSRPNRLPEAPFALTVGDNRPRKNLAVLARAWARMGPEPSLELVSAGPNDRRYPSLADLAQSEGARRVTSLGWVSEGELDWLYGRAEVVLFPTVYEGFGFPLAEAFARGVPTVASDIPVLHEIGDGVARFADPQDPDRWAEEVARLVRSPEEGLRLRALGRQRGQELSFQRTAEGYLALLREVGGEGREPNSQNG
ncbi:MAG TPA: glycosyltransferase family 1 protein [Candidatus Eisenbacteria bacterium]|jgi:glycosyltransferase involved in cell wall biosynthesis